MHAEYEILGAGHQFKKVMEKACAHLMQASGLRKVELDILYFLAHAGKNDTARDIIHTQHLSKAHISKSVDNLRRYGYIELVEDDSDHRCLHIRLTQKGMPVTEEFARIRRRVIESLFSGVTEEERDCVRRVLKKVMDNIDAELNSGMHEDELKEEKE